MSLFRFQAMVTWSNLNLAFIVMKYYYFNCLKHSWKRTISPYINGVYTLRFLLNTVLCFLLLVYIDNDKAEVCIKKFPVFCCSHFFLGLFFSKTGGCFSFACFYYCTGSNIIRFCSTLPISFLLFPNSPWTYYIVVAYRCVLYECAGSNMNKNVFFDFCSLLGVSLESFFSVQT